MWKPVLILSLSFIICDQQTPQLRMSGERQGFSLPQELTEDEAQNILKERKPKPHIDATLKISDARIASAYKFIRESEYKSAALDIDLYAALIIYADAYVRRLSDSEINAKNSCLKKIEQAIFKQSRTIDAVLLEFPHDYYQHAEAKFSQVKKIRLQAINDLLGGGKILKSS